MDRFQALVDAHVPGTGHRLKVAVLDTGIDVKHPELYDEARLKERRTWVHSAADVDRSGHGTHVASTILSLTTNVDVYVAKISEGITIESTDHIADVCATTPYCPILCMSATDNLRILYYLGNPSCERGVGR